MGGLGLPTLWQRPSMNFSHLGKLLLLW
jgi:hypothetical protein